MLKRSEIEKLPSHSIGGQQYVQLEALLAAIKEKEAEAKEAEAETTTRRALPRQPDGDEKKA